MALPQKDASKEYSEEYSVYIFHDPNSKQVGQTDWEKKVTTRNKQRAIAKARKLYASNDYERVEVKRKLSDSSSDMHFDTTFKVFKKREWKLKKLSKTTILVVGIMLGTAVSTVAFIYAQAYLQ